MVHSIGSVKSITTPLSYEEFSSKSIRLFWNNTKGPMHD